MTPGQASRARLLEAVLNLSRVHREHEKYYASAPLETAVRLHRHNRMLLALADRWTAVDPSNRQAISPFEGADDLNSDAAIQLDGVLFLEGEGRPAELSLVVAELRVLAQSSSDTGDWLATAMNASWEMTGALLEIDALADVLGERHRIICNDWLAAGMNTLMGHLLSRAADLLDRIDFAPAAVRGDLAGARVVPRRLYSAAELVARAADLCGESAALVHDNERRWRLFQARVEEVARGASAP